MLRQGGAATHPVEPAAQQGELSAQFGLRGARCAARQKTARASGSAACTAASAPAAASPFLRTPATTAAAWRSSCSNATGSRSTAGLTPGTETYSLIPCGVTGWGERWRGVGRVRGGWTDATGGCTVGARLPEVFLHPEPNLHPGRGGDGARHRAQPRRERRAAAAAVHHEARKGGWPPGRGPGAVELDGAGDGVFDDEGLPEGGGGAGEDDEGGVEGAGADARAEGVGRPLGLRASSARAARRSARRQEGRRRAAERGGALQRVRTLLREMTEYGRTACAAPVTDRPTTISSRSAGAEEEGQEGF